VEKRSFCATQYILVTKHDANTCVVWGYKTPVSVWCKCTFSTAS
jgi:hypothetical protein